MTDDNEFITRLIGLGFSEKEAQLYFHLFKYGPKPPTLLAKSLKTYREDVYRMLTRLMDKGMVNSSLETPTVYAAVELGIALDTALKNFKGDLHEMEMTKKELQELLKQQSFRRPDEFATYKIFKTVEDVFSYTVRVFRAAVHDIIFIIPAYALPIASKHGDHGNIEKASQRGVRVRGITDISYANLDTVREYADLYSDFDYELRHYYQYRGIYFAVVDGKTCVSAINVYIDRLSLDTPITMLWIDGPTYAKNLTSTFELLWEQSVPAAQRIEELLKEGPLDV